MKYEVWFFVGLFVFIFIVWIAIGGPSRGVSFNVPTPSLGTTAVTATTTSAGSYLSLPKAPFSIGSSNIVLPGSSNGLPFAGVQVLSLPPLVVVPGVTFASVSPYRGLVSLGGYVSGASSTDSREEYVQISVASGASAPVDITGWTLGSGATGHYATVPKGTAIPTSGVVNPVGDIMLRPGDSAYIISGASPVGASFRENKCIGYFGGFQRFTPSLPESCPSPTDEFTANYGKPYIHDPSCIDFVDTLSRCEVPSKSATDSAKLTLTCQDFLENYLNYNGCLKAHSGDADFDGTVWHIYLGRDTDEPLWRTRHEVIELLDRQGKTVDAFTY